MPLELLGESTLDAPIFDPLGFKLTDQQIELTTTARQLGQAKLAARAPDYDREAKFPTENYADLYEVGLMGICVPESYGGHGADLLTYSITAAEIGRYCGATALTWNMHVASTLWTGDLADELPIAEEDKLLHQQRRGIHYQRILDGAIYAQPFSEGGAAAAGKVAFSTQATPTEGGWLINGQKIFASLSGHADYYGILCTEIVDGGKPSRRNTLYMAIPADADGVSVHGEWDPMGMRGTVSRTLIFEDVFVPEDALLMPRGAYHMAARYYPTCFSH